MIPGIASAIAANNNAEDGGNDAFTELLLHCNGTDASTTFTDSSSNAITVSAGGNAQIDTAQFKFGTASGLFDGASDIISLDNPSTHFAFGTGDFTVDMWFRLSAIDQIGSLYDSRPAGTNGVYPTLFVDTDETLNFYVSSAKRITGGVLVADQWYHVAVARSGTSTKMFLDGVQIGSTYSDSNTYLNGGVGRPTMGRFGFDTGADFAGWIDEIRVSKGIARWTDNFTPPTAAYL